MGVGVEGETARLAELAVATGDRPAGEDIGELGDVALRVAGADAHGMQLEGLARQVLVQAAVVGVAGERIGTDRLRIVEEVEHRRMLLDGAQHVGETAEHMRTDRLALERAGGGAANAALGDRDAEVVRPERGQPLDIADRRRARLRQPRLGVGAEKLLFGARRIDHRTGGRHFGRRRGKDLRRDARRRHAQRGQSHRVEAVALRFAAPIVVENGLQDLRCRRKIGPRELRRIGAVEFGEQRLARVAHAEARAWPRAKAESIEGEGPGAIRRRHSRSVARAPATYLREPS